MGQLSGRIGSADAAAARTRARLGRRTSARRLGGVQLAFRVPPPAIDDWHAALIAKGVPIFSPPKELAGWRHRTLFFRDPEGNIVELYAEI